MAASEIALNIVKIAGQGERPIVFANGFGGRLLIVPAPEKK